MMYDFQCSLISMYAVFSDLPVMSGVWDHPIVYWEPWNPYPISWVRENLAKTQTYTGWYWQTTIHTLKPNTKSCPSSSRYTIVASLVTHHLLKCSNMSDITALWTCRAAHTRFDLTSLQRSAPGVAVKKARMRGSVAPCGLSSTSVWGWKDGILGNLSYPTVASNGLRDRVRGLCHSPFCLDCLLKTNQHATIGNSTKPLDVHQWFTFWCI